VSGFTEINRGASIMRRYNDPTRWVDGATVHPALRGKMVVRIPEAEVQGDNTQALVFANVAAIEAWAEHVKLLPHMPNHLIMNLPDNAAYMVVPKQHWQQVQQKLAAL